jgi:hypothetical protein
MQSGKEKGMWRECERVGRVCVTVFLAAAGACMAGDEEPPDCKPGQLTVSKETTYFTEPLREDGTVDYIAALNAHYGKGVTPENNAAVPLLRVVGPWVLVEEVRPEVLRRLGMEPLPPDGEYIELQWEGRTESEDLVSHDDLRRFSCEPWSKADEPEFAAWLERNDAAIETVKRATGRPRCFFPLVCSRAGGTPYESFLPDVRLYGSLSYALLARAMLRLHEAGSLNDPGRAEAAWSDVLAVHRLARLSAQGPWYIERLVAMAIEYAACDADSALAGTGLLPEKRLRRCIRELDALGPLPAWLPALDVSERCCRLDAAQALMREDRRAVEVMLRYTGSPGDASPEELLEGFQGVCWDVVLREINARYDAWVAAESQDTWCARREAVGSFFVKLNPLRRRAHVAVHEEGGVKAYLAPPSQPSREACLAHSRRAAVFLHTYWLPGIRESSEYHVRAVARWRMSKVVFALGAYRERFGYYPPALELLDPHYAGGLPRDPFSGKAFRYTKSGPCVRFYSVGPDMDDDGGRDEGEDEDDLTVELP